MAIEPNDVRRRILRRPQKELEAEVALANNLLEVLTRYLDQMCSHGPEIMSVESLLDHSLINYGLNTLEDYKNGRFAEALPLYDAAIFLDPKKASYRSNKSATLNILGRLLKAVFEAREAIRIDPPLKVLITVCDIISKKLEEAMSPSFLSKKLKCKFSLTTSHEITWPEYRLLTDSILFVVASDSSCVLRLGAQVG
nr:hypothetical protein [Tanacetum cinerariifolium]